ncbi:hypothetical protein AMTR_s00015p00258610 [Amborella trichopoda]|uniref:KANL3/Tex30 alpha/beta hydrolase-like domain-containing protein n=1 Tax=Amborella trichopoda TaxID=13333 RepID=W1PP39_AMBTC|nr:hypothetical protein AMTR_s00015p00258610 [Amborella trichopoda]
MAIPNLGTSSLSQSLAPNPFPESVLILILGTNGAVRDETLLQLSTPVMFVQGSKDVLCPLDKLTTICKKMKCPNELHVIEGGDHSFKIGKKILTSSGTTQDEAEENALKSIERFLAKLYC